MYNLHIKHSKSIGLLSIKLRRDILNETVSLVINIAVMIGLIYGLYIMQKKHLSFTKRVMTALILGIVFGVVLQFVYGVDSAVVKESNNWFYIVGTGYVRLLKMIVIPLIIVSIVSAILKLKDEDALKKMGIQIIGMLVFLTLIAAIVGAFTSFAFDLTAEGLESGQSEVSSSQELEETLSTYKEQTTQEKLTNVIPDNPFHAMTGEERTSTLSVVIFSGFIGVAALGVKRKKPESAEVFVNFMESLHDVVMRMVTLVLKLTPFGILALMTRVTSTSDFSQILKLITFVLASYAAIAIMFIIQLIFVAGSGLNPIVFVKKAFPVLTFAFTSRTSAGSIPLNIETQINKLGVPEGFANLSASFGATIGQNGCAGIYPAMLAVMIAPTVGIDPLSVGFLVKLILVITVSSFGVAGVGGGATFAALIVLSSMGLPVGLVGLFISIEPLIDMGRTALNVSGSMTTGVVTSKLMGEMDVDAYNKID